MNDEELKKLFEILNTADGGCPSCVKALFKRFITAFPAYKFAAFKWIEQQTEYPWDAEDKDSFFDRFKQ